MWFGNVESVSQLAFTCGLAAVRLIYYEFLTWSLAILILESACLGFYYPCSKTMQVIILTNTLSKVRSQKQPGTVPCDTTIKFSSTIMPQLPPS